MTQDRLLSSQRNKQVKWSYKIQRSYTLADRILSVKRSYTFGKIIVYFQPGLRKIFWRGLNMSDFKLNMISKYVFIEVRKYLWKKFWFCFLKSYFWKYFWFQIILFFNRWQSGWIYTPLEPLPNIRYRDRNLEVTLTQVGRYPNPG